MSKIGKKPIEIPEGVEVNIDGNHIIVKGPKGQLEMDKLDVVKIEKKDNIITFSTDEENIRFWGLTRTLINNMIEGVTKGFEKKLLIVGVGYGGQIQGNKLVLSLGLSHKVDFPIPKGIEMKTEEDPKGNTILTINGIDKQFVGEIASKIKLMRKPDPYQGKGVRYFGENIKLKPGKAAKK